MVPKWPFSAIFVGGVLNKIKMARGVFRSSNNLLPRLTLLYNTKNIFIEHKINYSKPVLSMSSSSDEGSIFSENENIPNSQMANIITPRSSAKFNNSIALIFNGFFDMFDHPRDPVNWSAFQVKINQEMIQNIFFLGCSVGRLGPPGIFNSRICSNGWH